MIMSNKNGFTLIEVIIATTLLSFIMMGVISISNDSIDTKERIITEDREKLQIQTALARIEWDFSHIYSPLYFSLKFESEKEEDNSDFDPEADNINTQYTSNKRFSFASKGDLPVPKILNPEKTSIEFFTTSNRNYHHNSKQSKYGWVRYFLKPMELNDEERQNELGTFKLMRAFSGENPFSAEGDLLDNQKSYEILEHVHKLELSFWDAKNKKFVSSLSELEDEEAKHLLRAIQLKIYWKGLPESEPIVVTKSFRPLWPYFKAVKKKELKNGEFANDPDNNPDADNMDANDANDELGDIDPDASDKDDNK